MAFDFIFDSTHYGSHAVHILHFDLGRKFFHAFRSNTNVGVAAERAFFHVCSADAEVANYVLKIVDVRLDLLGSVHVRFGYDFHKGSAGTIDVDQGMDGAATWTLDVNESGDVFFHVNSVNPNSYRIFDWQIDVTFVANGLVHLGNLVPLHEIWVRVVLAVELGDSGDVAVDRHADHHGVFDSSFVHDG